MENNIKDINKLKEEIFTVSQAQKELYNLLSEYTGWKLLKSQRCLRKRIGNIVFDINFFSSKYNLSGEHIEVNVEFNFWNKEFDKICNINSIIGCVTFHPENSYWYDITTRTKLNETIENIIEKINNYVFPLIEMFEKDYNTAILYLSNNDVQKIYHLDKFETFEKMLQL